MPSGAPIPTAAPTTAIPVALNPAQETLQRVRAEVGKAVVGQDVAVTGLLVGLLVGGHVLLEGVPGVAKTLLVRALSASLSLETRRVQFTPDLMPGDVTGSLIYNAQAAQFDFRAGPIFTNLLLADEINRTPPKTQAALLEAMEERQVSVDGTARMLPDPFMVIATQNPVEYEGTYPLPEAQLDRFLLKIVMPIPPRDDEISVLSRHAAGFDPRDLAAAGLTQAASASDLVAARQQVARTRVDQQVLGYIVDLCRATRSAPSVSLGASPRGATALLKTARAWAWLHGRDFVTPDDVKAMATITLGHRIGIRTEAQMDGSNAASILASVLATVPVPR
ncbi:MAG: MoxR family ATPase [Actinobacteria bacterium]|nr:MoxR family ATPase [Propionicimonas sp.]MBU3975473.1 MoxR family ATPase [Actinomycetota bacterium]MBU3986378.1 MoxR family ATPase [Actinomycetota bacterium]MBU4007947.1 MoxR family ATPase [Actinomycetota bacterium]MBU4064205.1 MoxR family ATPase [Actinomycetota bacterium]